MARKHKKYVCLKPLEGTAGKKCAVEGIKGVDEKSVGRFARRCAVKGVGVAYGRWKTPEGKKSRGWAVTQHGKQVTTPVDKREEALSSMGDYLGKLLEECKACD
jgi:hypothetical protein